MYFHIVLASVNGKTMAWNANFCQFIWKRMNSLACVLNCYTISDHFGWLCHFSTFRFVQMENCRIKFFLCQYHPIRIHRRFCRLFAMHIYKNGNPIKKYAHPSHLATMALSHQKLKWKWFSLAQRTHTICVQLNGIRFEIMHAILQSEFNA